MDTNFLKYTTSQAGKNCLAGLLPDGANGTMMAHKFVDFGNDQEVFTAYEQLQRQGAKAVYFATGTFTTNGDGKLARKADTCIAMRSFYLDIDAGQHKVEKHGDKVYLTQADALSDLNRVLDLGHLPRPTYIISSGEGLHVYWTAVDDIVVQEWTNYAKRLVQYCRQQKLRIDHLTANCAAVLRPIGTLHINSGNVVTPIEVNAFFNKESLLQSIAMLPVGNGPMAPPVGQALSLVGAPVSLSVPDVFSGIGEHAPASFGKIIEIQLYERAGCAQLTRIYEQQETMSEPEWYAGLTVASSCIDRDEWIHKISERHPTYDHGATEAKAAQVRGPFKCSDFELMNPSGCEGCPFRGTMTSPILLGRDPDHRPTVVMAPLSTDITVKEEFVVPRPPWPFYRKKDTPGIYYTEASDKDDNEAEEKCLLPYDVYIYDRIMDSSKIRQRFWCRYHSPQDGVLEFELDSDMIHSVNEAFKNRVTGVGLPVLHKWQWVKMSEFFNAQRANMIKNQKAVDAATQMGWTEEGSFIYGNVLLTRNGNQPAPVSDKVIAMKMTKAMKPQAPDNDLVKGLEIWNKCLHVMYNTYVQQSLSSQFVICTAMGAPLSSRFALASHAGGIISLCSAGSGRGKTFTCQTALRVFADPEALTYSSASGITNNALMTVLGYVNSIPLLRDEITEFPANNLADLIYDSTRLGDKERAQGSDNDIRDNKLHWRTFFYTTGNNSVYDQMASDRDNSQGPIRRVTEIVVESLPHLEDATKAKELASCLETVSGVAGKLLMEWVVQHQAEAKAIWDSEYTDFCDRYRVDHEERYWVNHLVSGCVGAVIGEKLNLHPFNASYVKWYAGQLLTGIRSRVSNRASSPSEYVGHMIANNIDSTLTITGDANSIILASDMPRQKVHIRIELKAGFMYITNQMVKDWCKQHHISIDEFEKELVALGGIPKVSKRMLANTQYAGGSTSQRTWKLPLIKEDDKV